MLKIWKGLFYCFWMSDKVPVQQELAQRLAEMMAPLHEDKALLFLRCFFVIMIREWGGIDRLRMDKFMSLVRKVVHQSLLYVASRGWELSLLERVADVYAELPLNIADLKARGVGFRAASLF